MLRPSVASCSSKVSKEVRIDGQYRKHYYFRAPNRRENTLARMFSHDGSKGADPIQARVHQSHFDFNVSLRLGGK